MRLAPALFLFGALALPARAADAPAPLPPSVHPTPEAPSSGWTGAGAVLLGESDPHGTSVDGYVELGRRLNADLSLLALALGEASLSSLYVRDVFSGGLALRLTGDRLGGLAAPLELTIGGGIGMLVQGQTPIGSGPYGLAFIDTVFPLTDRIRVHSNLVEHLNLTGAFLTAGIGVGLTFE